MTPTLDAAILCTSRAGSDLVRDYTSSTAKLARLTRSNICSILLALDIEDGCQQVVQSNKNEKSTRMFFCYSFIACFYTTGRKICFGTGKEPKQNIEANKNLKIGIP